MEYLCLAVAMLVVGAFVGVLVATALRAIAASAAPPRPRTPRVCPGCLGTTAPWDARCPACGLSFGTEAFRRAADARVSVRVLRDLAKVGGLDRDTADRPGGRPAGRRHRRGPHVRHGRGAGGGGGAASTRRGRGTPPGWCSEC